MTGKTYMKIVTMVFLDGEVDTKSFTFLSFCLAVFSKMFPIISVSCRLIKCYTRFKTKL